MTRFLSVCLISYILALLCILGTSQETCDECEQDALNDCGSQSNIVSYSCSSINGVVACSYSCGSQYSSSDSSPSYSSPSNLDSWTGVYDIKDGVCDTGVCCCLTGELTVESGSGTNELLLSAPLTGRCGRANEIKDVSVYPQGTSSNITFSLLGDSYKARKSGNSVYLTNVRDQRCSGQGTFNNAATMISFSRLSVVLSILGVLFMQVGLF